MTRLSTRMVGRSPRITHPTFELGFHGDRYLLSLVSRVLRSADAFVETGANVGTTTAYVARTYPHVQVYSCEPDPAAFAATQQRLSGFEHAGLSALPSPEFLHVVHAEHPELMQSRNLYWLDAHGHGYSWPLRDEVAFITHRLSQAVFIIDDFKVPGKPDFCFDTSEGDVCGFAYIRSALAKERMYRVIYPAYTEHTSPHHPLVGYAIVEFGMDAPTGVATGDENFTVTLFEA